MRENTLAAVLLTALGFALIGATVTQYGSALDLTLGLVISLVVFALAWGAKLAPIGAQNLRG